MLEEQDELREVRLRKLNAQTDAAGEQQPTKPAATVMDPARTKLVAKAAARKAR